MLLIHSPLVGPSSWSTLAPIAAASGLAVATPDLTGVAAAEPPHWQWFVDAAVRSARDLDGAIIVAGHSGAGVMLPTIAAALGDRCTTTVFIDAIVPPTSGAHRTSVQLDQLLDRHTIDGVLAPWLDWWPNATVAELLPSPEQRATVLADMPRLPRSFYDEAVPVPDDWSSRPNAYIQTSAAYDADRRAAAERGWPTTIVDSTHLGILTEPELAMASILEVIDR